MATEDNFTFVIITEKPHERYTRRIPFNHYPSSLDMLDAIERLKLQARADYNEDVQIKTTYLRQITTIEHDCVDLTAVNGPAIRVSTVSESGSSCDD